MTDITCNECLGGRNRIAQSVGAITSQLLLRRYCLKHHLPFWRGFILPYVRGTVLQVQIKI